MRFVDTNSDCICLNTTLMLSSMLVFVLWKPYSTSFHAKTLTELTLQTFSNKQRSFKSFPMHIHNVTLVKISLERRPRAFVHSFGHAKHRLLPSQIPYYSYARNLVSLDHVNSTFSQLVVFRLSESEYLKEIRFVAYWSMKSGACYENSCLVSKKNIFVNNIQGISIAALFVLSY